MAKKKPNHEFTHNSLCMEVPFSRKFDNLALWFYRVKDTIYEVLIRWKYCEKRIERYKNYADNYSKASLSVIAKSKNWTYRILHKWKK